ncbi:MAG: nucleotidyltransferase domain-containing protein [Defluviitaleaceae bacterium]|nr:nucleotidyltransferase domain-containing protein [Defluviitaleaceae bacterium]
MRTIKSFDELKIPVGYKEYLSQYLRNLSDISFINRVILYGSCAREDVGEHSDIDIFVTVDRQVTDADEYLVACECRPPHSMKSIPMDIIVQNEDAFTKHESAFGMLQKQVAKEGVDLSGFLH